MRMTIVRTLQDSSSMERCAREISGCEKGYLLVRASNSEAIRSSPTPPTG